MDPETFVETMFAITEMTEGNEEGRAQAFAELLKQAQNPKQEVKSPNLLPSPIGKSIEHYLSKSFSGQKVDAAGRKQCYRGGVHIPCAEDGRLANARKERHSEKQGGGNAQTNSITDRRRMGSGYERITFQGGSQWNVFNGSAEWLRSQALAMLAYAAMDRIPPTGRMVRFEGERVLVVPIPKTSETLRSRMQKGEQEDAIQKVQNRFVMDCFLRNVTAIGEDYQNIIFDEDGDVLRTVATDALQYDRSGKRVELSTEVTEMQTFRDGSAGKSLQVVYGSISGQMIWKQVVRLFTQQDRVLKVFPNNLRQIMAQRIEYLKVNYLRRNNSVS